MKKQFLFIATFLSVLSLSAQDTVRYGDSVYMFNPKTELVHYTEMGRFDINTEQIAQQYIVEEDSSVWVFGVALVNQTVLVAPMWDSLRPACSRATLHSYNSADNSVTLIDTARWRSPMPYRGIEHETHLYCLSHTGTGAPDTMRKFYRVLEYYFDQPHLMQDTFYVGMFQEHVHQNSGCPLVGLMWELDYSAGWDIGGGSTWIHFPIRDNYTYFLPGLNYDDTIIHHVRDAYADCGQKDVGIWGCLFPIVRPRTDICRTPGKPWLVDRTDTSITLEWDTLAMSAELAIASINGSPDNPDTIIALPAGSSGITITGLDPLAYYAFWLRQLCDWGRYGINASLWSDWTVRQIFSTNPAGIRGVDDVAFSLFPNPATDAFTVETPALDSRLTLFDIRGTELYSVDIRSTRTTIGIADLPTGVYFVSLTSPSGTTSKRLVVDRH